MRGALVAGVAALALLGCSSDGDDARVDRSATTVVSDASAVEPAANESTSTTTYAQADEPPAVVNTGTDFEAIVESFVAYMEWLAAHPDPSLVREIAEEGSRGWQQNHDVIRQLADSGTRFDGERPAYVAEVRVDRQPDESSVQLYVVVVNPGYAIVDSSGSAVEEHPDSPPVSAIWGLVRDPAGRWFLRELTTLGEVPS
ncbi:MAG: hypothetical protein ACRD29_10335 [Acidimicrobiales bacterium]